MDLPTVDDIERARVRLAPFVHRTPVLTCQTLSRMAGAELFFKAENFQKVGAFKFRGATNAVRSASESEIERGVVTHSSGNHAQALSLAAHQRGVPAYIVMPRNAPAAKWAAVEGYGGRITGCDADLESRETTLQRVQSETGALFVHPFDDVRVIAGQGTAAAELLEQVPDLDAILAPVGGGGLISGTALAASATKRAPRVIGVEPELADDAYCSLREGRIFPPRPPRTIADGLLTCLSERTFAVMREHVAQVALVGEQEILDAMRWVWERAKIIIEPSAAVPVAAAIFRRVAIEGARVGIILSGGNVDLCRNELCHFWKT